MRNTSENETPEKIPTTAESIGSFDDASEKQTLKEISHAVSSTPSRPRRATVIRHAAVEAKGKAKDQLCPCAANVEDEVMVQCEGCSVWYHIPCAGSVLRYSCLLERNERHLSLRYLQESDLPETYECIICRLETAGQVSAEKIEDVRNYLPTLTLERRALKKMYKKTQFENVHNMQREVRKSSPFFVFVFFCFVKLADC